MVWSSALVEGVTVLVVGANEVPIISVTTPVSSLAPAAVTFSTSSLLHDTIIVERRAALKIIL